MGARLCVRVRRVVYFKWRPATVCEAVARRTAIECVEKNSFFDLRSRRKPSSSNQLPICYALRRDDNDDYVVQSFRSHEIFISIRVSSIASTSKLPPTLTHWHCVCAGHEFYIFVSAILNATSSELPNRMCLSLSLLTAYSLHRG